MSGIVWPILIGGIIGMIGGGACMWVAIGLAHSRVSRQDRLTRVLPAAILAGALFAVIGYSLSSGL